MATLPSFRTWTAGELVTAAYMNGQIRDPGNFWLARPIAKLRQTVAQSLTTGANTAITMDAEDIDSDNGHSLVTNTSRYTPQTAGWAMYGGGVSFASNATGIRLARWAQNGTNINDSDSLLGAVSGNTHRQPARTTFINSNGSTDYVELLGTQTSGGALNTAVASGEQSSMSVYWLST